MRSNLRRPNPLYSPQIPNRKLNMQNYINKHKLPTSLRYSHGLTSANKPAYVYYLKFEFTHITIYKIGFTRLEIEQRIKQFKVAKSCKVTVLGLVYCLTALEAFNIEREILNNHRENRLPPVEGLDYKSKQLLASGNSECWLVDILGLDKANKNS